VWTRAVDPFEVMVLAAPLGLIGAGVSWWWRRRRGRDLGDVWVDGALVFSLVVVALATFTPLSVFGEVLGTRPNVQLAPLERLDGAPVEFAVINLLLLAPVAFLLVLRGRRARLVGSILLCVALSIGIETLQLLHPLRGTNVDDVLLNSLGAVGGAVLGGFARLVRPTTRRRTRRSPRRSETHGAVQRA
jgi:glycopeptide antibiotics resistance protein